MAPKDFDIKELADYLHLTLQQVEKLANRERIPGRRVGGEWRFSEAEIHHWLENRMGLADDDELAQMENALERAAQHDDEEVSLAAKMPIEAVAIPLRARTRAKVITAMTEVAVSTGLLWDPVKMSEAIRTREDMSPTALDNGVALLHPRRPLPSILGGPLIALGRVDGGVPFGAAGGGLTDLFFLICSMDDRRHLRVLARLARLISNDAALHELRVAADAEEVRNIIVAREREIAG